MRQFVSSTFGVREIRTSDFEGSNTSLCHLQYWVGIMLIVEGDAGIKRQSLGYYKINLKMKKV